MPGLGERVRMEKSKGGFRRVVRPPCALDQDFHASVPPRSGPRRLYDRSPVVAEAAKLNADSGATLIDINFGCPVKKVVNGHAGSSLMRDELHAARILEATVKAVDLPVTLKMRTGWDDNHRNAPALAKIAESCGIRMVTVHGRTRCQFYAGNDE